MVRNTNLKNASSISFGGDSAVPPPARAAPPPPAPAITSLAAHRVVKLGAAPPAPPVVAESHRVKSLADHVQIQRASPAQPKQQPQQTPASAAAPNAQPRVVQRWAKAAGGTLGDAVQQRANPKSTGGSLADMVQNRAAKPEGQLGTTQHRVHKGEYARTSSELGGHSKEAYAQRAPNKTMQRGTSAITGNHQQTFERTSTELGGHSKEAHNSNAYVAPAANRHMHQTSLW
jgi:hypothetical protein